MIYTFVLFFIGSALGAYVPVYYTDAAYLGGSLESFNVLVSVSAISEWILVMVFAAFVPKFSSKLVFALVPFFGIFRALPVYLAETPALAATTFIFNALWFGVLWAAATPYIKALVSKDGNVFAQGVWNFVAMGAGTLAGSFVCGILAEARKHSAQAHRKESFEHTGHLTPRPRQGQGKRLQGMRLPLPRP